MLGGCSKTSFCPRQDVSPHTLLTWQRCRLLRREDRHLLLLIFTRRYGTCTHPHVPQGSWWAGEIAGRWAGAVWAAAGSS